MKILGFHRDVTGSQRISGHLPIRIEIEERITTRQDEIREGHLGEEEQDQSDEDQRRYP
ncbi:MAG: hypothetical protein R3C44_04045 [Chloroflexota bacterium]